MHGMAILILFRILLSQFLFANLNLLYHPRSFKVSPLHSNSHRYQLSNPINRFKIAYFNKIQFFLIFTYHLRKSYLFFAWYHLKTFLILCTFFGRYFILGAKLWCNLNHWILISWFQFFIVFTCSLAKFHKIFQKRILTWLIRTYHWLLLFFFFFTLLT